MPTYEYKCQKCLLKTDVLHKVSEKPKIICDFCSQEMKKEISCGIGLHFKGSGFYETDYKTP